MPSAIALNGVEERISANHVLVPRWDEKSRELWLGVQLLKRFRQPAQNQERILASFQELGWPPHIDDPLPGGDNVVRQERLHYAVRRLKKQLVPLILFECDGLGKGVTWRLIKSKRRNKRPRSAPPAPQKRPLRK